VGVRSLPRLSTKCHEMARKDAQKQGASRYRVSSKKG
jgi:hypothetical protein